MRDGELIPLPPKALDLLLALVETQGRVVGKEELLKRVWPHTFVEEGRLTQNISTSRKTLGHNGDGPQYIETVSKRGYRFVVPRRPADMSPETQLPHPVLSGTEHGAHDRGPALHVRLRQWGLMSAAAAVLVAIALAVNMGIATKPAAKSIGSLAVLPLENLSHDPAQKYFADGMTDALITSLGKIGALRVVSRSSVMPYKGPGSP